jgi:hypothetical protein
MPEAQLKTCISMDAEKRPSQALVLLDAGGSATTQDLGSSVAKAPGPLLMEQAKRRGCIHFAAVPFLRNVRYLPLVSAASSAAASALLMGFESRLGDAL